MNFLNNSKFNTWVTGHKGFIGSRLCTELKENSEIFKISRNDIIEANSFLKNRIHINELDQNYLNKLKENYLFHLATLYNPNPKNNKDKIEIIESNINFGLRIIDFFENNFFEKIILTQSYMELQKENFNNFYVESKSKFLYELSKKKKDKLIIVYLYDTFGLNDKRKKLLSIWLNQLLNNKPVIIHSTDTILNLSSDKFISRLLCKSIKLNPGKYEIRSDVEISLIELFEILRKITGSKSDLVIKDKKPVKIYKKYENLSDILKIEYTIKDFEKDLSEIINKEF